MIRFKHVGDFSKSTNFFNRVKSRSYLTRVLDKYGKIGVSQLAAATPIDTGETASSWGYEIDISGDSCSIVWTNSNVVDGAPIAILLQYGHATRFGGYVEGIDYINPALKPVFEQILEEVWEEVTT